MTERASRFCAALAQAAIEESVPLAALLAIWQRECSLDPVCPRERSIDPYSFGPMQVSQAAAWEHGCTGDWRSPGSANARCAARIVSDWQGDRRARGRWTLVFTAYHRPEDLRDFGGKPSGYGMEVAAMMRTWERRGA